MTSLILLSTLGQTSFQSIKDVQYATVGGINLKLDLSIPKTPGAKALVIWIHGGGWQAGDKADWQPARALQARHPEFAVASINYRLTDQAIHPAQTNDCKTAIAFLRRNAAKFNLDPKRFAAFGSSAGGHLVSMVGTSDEWTKLDSVTNDLSKVSAVVDYYGPTDLVALATTPGYTSHALPDSPESKLLGGPVLQRKAEAAIANPITYVSRNDPPFYIVHGSADPVVSPTQSLLLANALKAKKDTATTETLPGAKHGGPEFVAPALIDRVAAFLTSVFSKVSTP